MTRTVLWVDEDYDIFPTIKRRVRRAQLTLVPRRSLSDASEYLKTTATPPAVVILDVLVATGDATEYVDVDSGLFPGSLLLKQHPTLAPRTIVLSIVDEHTLRENGFQDVALFVSKLALASHLKQLEDTLEALKKKHE